MELRKRKTSPPATENKRTPRSESQMSIVEPIPKIPATTRYYIVLDKDVRQYISMTQECSVYIQRQDSPADYYRALPEQSETKLSFVSANGDPESDETNIVFLSSITIQHDSLTYVDEGRVVRGKSFEVINNGYKWEYKSMPDFQWFRGCPEMVNLMTEFVICEVKSDQEKLTNQETSNNTQEPQITQEIPSNQEIPTNSDQKTPNQESSTE
jgi:hypothetical protein